MTYTYDPAGNRATLKLNGQLHVSYDYDDAGRLWHIYRGSKVFTFGYDGASRRTSLSYPNGVVTTYGYDTLSRLTNVTTKLGTTVIAASTYTHDDAGNRLTKTTESYSESYDYDPTYRLDTVTRDFVLTEDYGYDSVGNRLSALNYPTWTYNDRNELQSFNGTSYTYDLNGNRVGKTDASGSWTYGWNWESQLLNVFPPTGAVAFRYETLGRRVWKNAGATNQRAYTYDGEDILRETNWVTGATLTFIHGPGIDELLAAEDQNGNFFYAHADGLGSVVKATNASGQVITTKQYDAFGNIQIGASDGRYAFTGREWDPETGLYYYRARYYDPKVGRFLSEDPIGFLGGINFYGYVGMNPTTRFDALGLSPQDAKCKPQCDEADIRARKDEVHRALDTLEKGVGAGAYLIGIRLAETWCASLSLPDGTAIGDPQSYLTPEGEERSPCVRKCLLVHEQVHARQCKNLPRLYSVLSDFERERPGYISELSCLIKTAREGGFYPW